MKRLEKAARNFQIAQALLAGATLFLVLGRGKVHKERGRLQELTSDNTTLLGDLERVRIQLDGALARIHEQRHTPDAALDSQGPHPDAALDEPAASQGGSLDQPAE
jgi:hypothetical protein